MLDTILDDDDVNNDALTNATTRVRNACGNTFLASNAAPRPPLPLAIIAVSLLFVIGFQ